MPERNPARLIYGVLAIGAVLAAESGSHEDYLDTAGSAVIAILLYWLAHAYADVLGHRLTAHVRLSIAVLGRALRDEAAILIGSVLPLLALLSAGRSGSRSRRASKRRSGQPSAA